MRPLIVLELVTSCYQRRIWRFVAMRLTAVMAAWAATPAPTTIAAVSPIWSAFASMPKLLKIGETAVETALVPEVIFRTADAAMAGLNREGNAAIPPHRRTGVVGRRPLAAHFIQATALAGVLVVPLFDEFASVEMRAAIAFVVDALRIEHFWPALPVEFRQPTEGE